MAKTKHKRKALSVKTRFEVFKRDAFVCQYCGAHPPAAILHVDHIIPVAEGGTNDEGNLVTSCSNCNLGEGARQLSDIPQSLNEKAAETAEREEQIRGYAEVMAAKRERVEADCWSVVRIFYAHYNGVDDEDISIRREWFGSIQRFVNDLGVGEVIEAMDIALAKNHRSEYQCFKYFCGVCWRKIKGDLE
ncbi:MAG: HNH endonuclease [Granulosicoccaceae bacterium]